ncbi:MAG: hypothetical protein ACPL4H_10115, partial [Anaerolineales bacterium]
MSLVGRLIEQSQTRVEGANFDMRKHLLEYDDVLNTQRASIYSQRDRIFTKEDLSEDVTEMLQTEVLRRVPEALKEEEGPWRLLSWLEQIQPPLQINSHIYPSYTLKLIVDDIWERSATAINGEKRLSTQAAIPLLLEVARAALTAEDVHIVNAVKNVLEETRQRYENQLAERLEAFENFLDSLKEMDDEQSNLQTPRQITDELSSAIRIPIKLSNEQARLLKEEPHEVDTIITDMIQNYLWNQSLTRLMGAITRRVEDEVEFRNRLADVHLDWDELEERVLEIVEQILNARQQRLVGTNGSGNESQIGRDLTLALEKANGYIDQNGVVGLLLLMLQGARTEFDKRTHKRIQIRTQRLNYIFLAAHLLENRSSDTITQEVLEHLTHAQKAIQLSLGLNEYNRLSDHTLMELDETARAGIEKVLGLEMVEQISNQPLSLLAEDLRYPLIEELGRQALTTIYRQLLLGVISELWVDYLTQMEALRVSIGLEAYAQRDPLVQYKSRASELFQELVTNMRLGVISRMFTYRPRELAAIKTVEREEEERTQERESTPTPIPDLLKEPISEKPESDSSS